MFRTQKQFSNLAAVMTQKFRNWSDIANQHITNMSASEIKANTVAKVLREQFTGVATMASDSPPSNASCGLSYLV